MSITAKERANSVLSFLNATLVENQSTARTNESVKEAIEDAIKSAYDGCANGEEKKKYCNALTAVLHPDKFANSEYSALYTCLYDLGLGDEPFKIIDQLKKKNDLFRNFWKKAYKEPYLLIVNAHNNPLLENLYRYIFPLKQLAALFVLLGMALAGLVGLASLVLYGLAAFLTNIAQQLMGDVVSVITGGIYDGLIDNNKASRIDDFKSSYLKNLRSTMISAEINDEHKQILAHTIEPMSDDKFWNYIVEHYITKKYGEDSLDNQDYKNEAITYFTNKIKESIPLRSKDRLLITWLSLYNTISLPMNELNVNYYFALLIIKPLQLIASPFLLAGLGILELTDAVLEKAFYLCIGIDIVLFYAMLAVINLPLYVFDVAKSLGGNSQSEEDVKAETPRNAMGQLLIEMTPLSDGLKSESAPGHYNSPLSSQSDKAEQNSSKKTELRP